MKLKHYSGHCFIRGKQYHATVAAPTKKRSAQLADVPLHYFNDYWGETGNAEQIAATTAKPETLLIQRTPYGEWAEPTPKTE